MKILHIVGGKHNSGAFMGANILHNALLELDVNSKLLNDTPFKINNKNIKNIVFINNNFIKRLVNKLFIYFEKILKSFYLPSPRGTFTLGLFGFNIVKLKEYKEADIIHIHWLNQGFIKLKSFSKVNKPVIWTMRDMWAFTGGSHYTMEFEKYEVSYLSKIIRNYKKKIYNKNFQFIAISEWLKNKAQKSSVLQNYKIKRIYNNIDIKDFNLINKDTARSTLKISTKKKLFYMERKIHKVREKGGIYLLRH